MNERIIELAAQAGLYCNEYGLFFAEEHHDEGVDLDKFVELLLAEYAEDYRKLCDGEQVVIPRDQHHAESMVRVGMFYLNNTK